MIKVDLHLVYFPIKDLGLFYKVYEALSGFVLQTLMVVDVAQVNQTRLQNYEDPGGVVAAV